MATNIYIGARYVPKFDGDWDSTKVYEPLTVVNYNGGSYTSKRAVPANISPTNTDYWALTGNYNGQISHLQQEIDSQQVVLNSHTEKLNLLTSHKFLLCGDSYGTYTNNVYAPFLTCLGYYGGNNYKNISDGGSGFIDPNSFISQIINYNLSIPRNEITDIIVVGGVNDADPNNSPTYSGILTAIEEFMAYAKANYPNAKVYIGCAGGVTGSGLHANYNANLNTVVLRAYKDCTKYGAIYLNGVENVMNDYYECFDPDGVHPSATGAALIGLTMAKAWLSGYGDVTRYTNDYTLASGVSAHSQFVLHSNQENDKVTIEIGGLLNFPSNLVNVTGVTTPIPLFTMFSPYYKGLNDNAVAGNCIPLNVQLFTYDGSYHAEGYHAASLYIDSTGAGILYLEEYLASAINDVGRVYIPRQSFTLDLFKHR